MFRAIALHIQSTFSVSLSLWSDLYHGGQRPVVFRYVFWALFCVLASILAL